MADAPAGADADPAAGSATSPATLRAPDVAPPASEPHAVEVGTDRRRREAPLVPASSVAGRALVSLVAIMTFLAALAAGGALLVAGASRDWRAAVAREATVQVMPVAGRDPAADLARAAALAAAAPGVASVEVYGRERAARLLEPWLGAGLDLLDLADLPVPGLVAVRLDPGGGFDGRALAAALATAVPGAALDQGDAWQGRLAAAAGALEAVAGGACALSLAALGLAVSFATRGAMAGNSEIIGVLHFVGAEDRFIAREFQRRFLRLGVRGAAIGGALAALAFPLAGLAARGFDGANADPYATIFGRFALGFWGYGAVAAVAVGAALLTGWTSRAIVFRHLRGLA